MASVPSMPGSILARLGKLIWNFIVDLLWPSVANVPQVWGYPVVGILPIML